MLSTSEALHRILALAPLLPAESVPLRLANQRVLREDVLATEAYPALARAATEGYAIFRHRLGAGESQFRLQAPAPSVGDFPAMMASDANALRVKAGDPLPLGADGVVPLARCRVVGHEVFVLSEPAWETETGVLARGAVAAPGDVLLEAGHLIHATHVGWMAATGVEEVVVSKPPRLLAIDGRGSDPTGSALWALEALWQEWGALDWSVLRVADPEAAMAALRANTDMDVALILSTVNRADPNDALMRLLRQTGLELRVNGLSQSPGGDMLVARSGPMPIFVLPPDPWAALACARRFVWPLLDRASGIPSPVQRRLNLCGQIPHATDITRLLPCHWSEQGVECMETREPAALHDIAHSDGLVEIPAGEVSAGQSVLFFPWRRL